MMLSEQEIQSLAQKLLAQASTDGETVVISGANAFIRGIESAVLDKTKQAALPSIPLMTASSRVPDDWQADAMTYRAGWNDCRSCYIGSSQQVQDEPVQSVHIEAIKSAIGFIENGVEFGYIRMPDDDTPDNAHKTLPLLREELKSMPTPKQSAAIIGFSQALTMCDEGFSAWSNKPHNKKWVKRIDGTPIKNDLLCCIAEAFSDQSNDYCDDIMELHAVARFEEMSEKRGNPQPALTSLIESVRKMGVEHTGCEPSLSAFHRAVDELEVHLSQPPTIPKIKKPPIGG